MRKNYFFFLVIGAGGKSFDDLQGCINARLFQNYLFHKFLLAITEIPNLAKAHMRVITQVSFFHFI